MVCYKLPAMMTLSLTLFTTAVPLTEEEFAEKEELQKVGGFTGWTKRDYQAFIRGCEKYGRKDIENIRYEVGKPLEEVQRYSEVFWERYQEIEGEFESSRLYVVTAVLTHFVLVCPDWERQMAKIEEAEKQHAKNARLSEMLKSIVAKYKHPLQQLIITYPIQSRTKIYSEEEDRFLIVSLSKYGLGSEEIYEKIKREVLEFPGFRFDWFIKSRSPIEISRRCQTLISLVQKEYAPEEAKLDPVRKARGPRKKTLGGLLDGHKDKDKDGDGASDNGSISNKKRDSSLNGALDDGMLSDDAESNSAPPPPAKKRKSTGSGRKVAVSRGSTPNTKPAGRPPGRPKAR